VTVFEQQPDDACRDVAGTADDSDLHAVDFIPIST
jgi:hypothetical protein